MLHTNTETSPDLTDRFARDGFVVVDDLADPATLDAMRQAYDGMLDGSIPCPGTDRQLGGITRQIMLPHRHHPVFAESGAMDRARAVASRLLGTETPEFLYSMLIYKPAGHPHETPWHQDMSYAGKPVLNAGTRWPNDLIVQFWLALDDVDETMGCMEFIPGRQNEPMLPHVVASGDPADDGRLLAISEPERMLDASTAVRCPLKAGSATAHGYATPHYTGPNRSERGRRAFIFSFADAPRLAEATRSEDPQV